MAHPKSKPKRIDELSPLEPGDIYKTPVRRYIILHIESFVIVFQMFFFNILFETDQLQRIRPKSKFSIK